ncbi:MAG: autotransporter-associated beta strand repeat-containing protein, partial [Thermoguttaceae bacterium]
MMMCDNQGIFGGLRAWFGFGKGRRKKRNEASERVRPLTQIEPLKRNWSPAGARRAKKNQPRPRAVGRFEPLEARQLLTTYVWTGAAGTADLATAKNWSENSLPAITAPTPGSALAFPGAPSAGAITNLVNDLPAGTSFSSITVQSGSVALSGNPIGLTAGITVDAGVKAATINLPIALSGANTFSVATSLTLAGAVSGSGSLIVSGGGTLTLAANNSYAATTIQNGMLQVGSGSVSGTLGRGNVTDNGSLVFDSASPQTYGGNISGAGSLTQNGAGALTLTGSVTQSNGTTIGTGSSLQFSGMASGSSSGGTITDNGVLTFDYASPTVVSATIVGTGSVVQEGSPVTLTAGNNTYAGGTTINNGTVLQIGNGVGLGSVGNSGVADNGSLVFDSPAS